MMGRKLPAVLAAAAVACTAPVAASAQGNAADATPKAWATAFCTSLVTWQKTVQVNGGKLEKTLASLKSTGDLNMRGVRTQFVTFLDGLASSTDHVRVVLHRTGAPAVPHGAQIQRQLELGFTNLAGNFRGIATRARTLPLGNADAFVKRADALGTAISKATDGLDTALAALDKYDASAIEAAGKTVPACKALG